MTEDVTLDRGWDDIASTTTAILLAIGLIATAGIGLTVTGADEPADAATATAADAEQADTAGDDAETIDWQGNLANDVCAPAGPYVCYGTSIGEADDRYDTRMRDAAVAQLEMTWEADTPTTEELELSLASGYKEDCGDSATCYYWTTKATAVGPSPLTLEANDLTVEEDATLWLLVDAPDRTPGPVYSDAHTEQAFTLTGELVPEGATTDGAQ